MAETSTKPYMIRALYEWCSDNGYTPYLSVFVDQRTIVPRQFVRNGEIVLNVAPLAINRLVLGNELIEFQARFNGKTHDISIPVDNVSAIYSRESGHGMAFEVLRQPDGDPSAWAGDEHSGFEEGQGSPVARIGPAPARADGPGEGRQGRDEAARHPGSLAGAPGEGRPAADVVVVGTEEGRERRRSRRRGRDLTGDAPSEGGEVISLNASRRRRNGRGDGAPSAAEDRPSAAAGTPAGGTGEGLTVVPTPVPSAVTPLSGAKPPRRGAESSGTSVQPGADGASLSSPNAGADRTGSADVADGSALSTADGHGRDGQSQGSQQGAGPELAGDPRGALPSSLPGKNGSGPVDSTAVGIGAVHGAAQPTDAGQPAAAAPLGTAPAGTGERDGAPAADATTVEVAPAQAPQAPGASDGSVPETPSAIPALPVPATTAPRVPVQLFPSSQPDSDSQDASAGTERPVRPGSDGSHLSAVESRGPQGVTASEPTDPSAPTDPDDTPGGGRGAGRRRPRLTRVK